MNSKQGREDRGGVEDRRGGERRGGGGEIILGHIFYLLFHAQKNIKRLGWVGGQIFIFFAKVLLMKEKLRNNSLFSNNIQNW